MNKIDKSAWQATLMQYRTWNDAKLREHIRNIGKKSLSQKWREFLALMEFGLKIKPQPSAHEQCQKMEILNQYYQRIHRFEAWRRQHGKSS
jgi:hypothetical protein